jgi:signal transduction histidine kinase
LIGSLFDITDNFENLNRFIIIGDTPTQAFIEKFIGFLLGYIALFVGILYWLPANKQNMAKEKNTFVSIIAHSIRTPLTSIFGSLQLIKHSEDAQDLPENLQQTLDIAMRNSRRLTQLINNILDMQDLESGKLGLNIQHYRANDLIEEAIRTNQAHATKFRTKYNVTYGDREWFIPVDEKRFLQALGHLLSNAAKFTRYGSDIDVRLEEQKNHIRISIQDYGFGIDEESQQKLFIPFARFNNDNSEEAQGQGLGLALSQQLLQKMNGCIGFISKADEGSTFYIELPLIHGEQNEA